MTEKYALTSIDFLQNELSSGYWPMVKFAFNIPFVLTSSAMCIIINSISEKCDLFRRLSQQLLLLLTGKIENDDIIDENEFKILAMSDENLANDIPFEEVPNQCKLQVVDSFKDRHFPC
jgi:hypothetical protein